MKKNLLPLLMIVLTLVVGSCDKIEGPYKEPISVSEFCSTGVDDTITPHRKVLAEDYTGHLCGNCPDGGVYLNDSLKASYSHCLIIISVHAGYFAETCPPRSLPPGAPTGSFATDFRSQTGTDWDNFFGISATGNPKGMVNRINFPSGSQSLSKDAWAPAIATELAKKADAKITVGTLYNSANRTVTATVKTNFLNDLTGNYKLQVVLTEDSIIDWQEWYNHTPELVPDFVHHHILRGSLNSSFGENIASGTVPKGTAVTKSYNYTLSNAWSESHCSIVAFVYNDNTKEVMQVEEQKVQ